MKKDILVAAIIGFLVALLLLVIKLTGNIDRLNRLPYVEYSLVAFPLLAALGIAVASALGKRVRIVFQGAKFLLVGVLNTFLDLGVLNILTAATGVTGGILFAVFKGFTFLLAVANSYLWNKYWTFSSRKGTSQDFVAQGKEFAQFLVISGVGFFLNVGTASAVVNFIEPQFGLSERAWPTAGALAGTLVVLTWNFLGYKLIVFKR
ncbi:MAG TPA: GtrA family protein [Candidatus Paceibacterota bacterium]|nr:GtrA family protein [Candidatus Paceibacterota bacterium]